MDPGDDKTLTEVSAQLLLIAHDMRSEDHYLERTLSAQIETLEAMYARWVMDRAQRERKQREERGW